MFGSKRIRTVCLVGALSAPAPVALTPTRAHAEIPAVRKVAMVDLQRVLNSTKAGQKARAELEASTKAKQAKVDKRQKQLESDYAKLQQLSGQQLAAAQEKLQKQSVELQSMMYTLEQELAQQQNKLLETIYRNAQAIVSGVAKTKGLDLVLVRDDMTVIFAKPSLDITDEVVKLYDAKHNG